MPLTPNELKNLIKQTATNSIRNYILNHKEISTFQILDILIPRERKIRSIVGGMETSLGSTLWEPISKSIAQSNGFLVINDNLQSPAIMPASLSNVLQNILEARELQNGQFTAILSHQRIRETCQQFINNPIHNFVPPPKGNGVDIWLRKNNIEYFFDTKTVHPNIGKFREFISQLLNWYAYYYSRYPLGTAFARIVFPYNPYQGNFWEKSKGNGRPLEPINEAFIENDFWDFISGRENTFQLIREGFDELKQEGILQDEFDQIFENNQ